MSSKIVREHPLKIRLYKTQPVLVLSVLLVCVTLAIYWPLGNNDFINFDDNIYVTENKMVKKGLTIEGIHWAFRFNDKGYWHPLTWLAHMIDYELFGLNPTGHHFANLMIHLSNTLLLFWILNRTTKCVYRSALVAAIFALHPLNVESVAWASERKNVLSTFFWFLTILLYTYYVQKQNIRNYIGVLACFVLALMTKPMAVTLPFLMILLDFWPLGRIKFRNLKLPAGLLADKTDVSGFREVNWSGILLEKTPLLIFSALSILLSIFSLQQMENMMSESAVPLKIRLANALISYISYIDKVFWPRDLSIFYPFPKLLLSWQIIGSFACLTGISLFSIAAIRRRPYVFVGWFWYVGTLLPVSGIVQSGLWPSLADRWAYVPVIGLFVIIVWGISDLCRKFYNYKSRLVAVCVVVLLVFAIQTRRQLLNWVDSVTLFQHTLQATGDNEIAYYCLGYELVKLGKLAEGIDHYRSALRIKPEFFQVHNNLGRALVRYGDNDKAIFHFQNAVRINPNYAIAHNNLGLALMEREQMVQAGTHFMQALRLAPAYAEAHNNWGTVLMRRGEMVPAGWHFVEALRLTPDYAEAYNNLGILLMQQGKVKAALSYFNKALDRKPDLIRAKENLMKASAELEQFNRDVAELQIEQSKQPGNPQARLELGNLYKEHGEFSAAANQYQKALSIQPGLLPALNKLAIVQAARGNYDNAIELLKDILIQKPDMADPYYNIAAIYARQDKKDQSIHWLKKAVAKGYQDWDNLKQDNNFNNIRNTSFYKKLMGKSAG